MIILLPSNGMPAAPGCMRGSSMTRQLPSSRAARDGHTIQEKTTVSPG